MGIMGYYFPNLSNEEKFVLADVAACKAEEMTGKKMTPKEYEEFVWNFISGLYDNKQEENKPHDQE
jgi:hypothetical protein